MELDANKCSDVQVDVTSEETQVSNPPVDDSFVDNHVALENEEKDEENKTTRTTDQPLDGADDDAPIQSVKSEFVNKSEFSMEIEDATATDEDVENREQKDVAMAEPKLDATSLVSDPVVKQDNEAQLTGTIGIESAGQEGNIEKEIDAGTLGKNDGRDGSTEANCTTPPSLEVKAGMELSENKHEAEKLVHQSVLVDDTVMDTLIDNADSTDPPKDSVEKMDVVANEGKEEAKEELVNTEDGICISVSPRHDEKDHDLSTSTMMTSFVPHGDDEYDPANPSSGGAPVVSSTTTTLDRQFPASQQEEYTLDYLSGTTEDSVPMNVDHNSSNGGRKEQSTVTSAKRKADDEINSVSTNGSTEAKRSRHVDDKRDDEHKHGRHRAESGDTTSSSSSREKHHEEDHKGLAPAAWDRLMDFQTSGEFRVTQVSRAAFASVGAMPEFAQLAIITRFVRTPMRDVRDKNGQLMRIYREYQKENPQIAVLQPVDTFISDYKSDAGLFRFGYAPPQPATGISNVPVPYQRDPLPEDLPVKNSSRHSKTTTARSEADKHQHKDVDEFGRAVHQEKGSAKESNGQRSTVDPRLSARSRPGLSSPTTPARRGGKTEELRRHEKPSTTGAGRDPRRRGASTSQQQQSLLHREDSSNAASELYERLPAPVRAVVDTMRHEGRLHEQLNDNVITRLLHLPERVALQAVENFSNVDLSQVENLQGFLVGIINRVNEKAIASEKQHRPSPRGHGAPPPGNTHHGGASQSGSVLGGPPQGGRLNSNNGPNSGGYRGQVAPMAAGPGSALYDRPYDGGPQDTRDPRRRQPGPQGPPQYSGGGRGPTPAGAAAAAGHAPIGMHSFTLLPVSVQNHVHSLVANRTLASLEELGGKCYEVLGQLSEPLANQVLTRFAGANLSNVRNKSGFLIGVVKRARQEYGFN